MKIKRFLSWVAVVAGVVSTSVSGWDLIKYWGFGQTTLSIMAHIYVLSLSACALIFSAIRNYQTNIKERYANITPNIHMVQHTIRNLETYLDEKSRISSSSIKEIEDYLMNARNQVSLAMTHLVGIFSSLTSTNCRACVKLSYPVEDADGEIKLHFYAYSRDNASLELCRETDQERVENNHDSHDDNPYFAQVCSPDDKKVWHFCCNNLLKLPSYVSSSLLAYNPNYGAEYTSGSLFDRWMNNRWPLPYKSFLACVIRQAGTDHLNMRQCEVLGFVSVDSESRGVFQEKWDKEIIFSVADSLFRPIKRIIEVDRLLEARKIENDL